MQWAGIGDLTLLLYLKTDSHLILSKEEAKENFKEFWGQIFCSYISAE